MINWESEFHVTLHGTIIGLRRRQQRKCQRHAVPFSAHIASVSSLNISTHTTERKVFLFLFLQSLSNSLFNSLRKNSTEHGFAFLFYVFGDLLRHLPGADAPFCLAFGSTRKRRGVLPQQDLERSKSIEMRVRCPKPVSLDRRSHLRYRTGPYSHVWPRRRRILRLPCHWFFSFSRHKILVFHDQEDVFVFFFFPFFISYVACTFLLWKVWFLHSRSWESFIIVRTDVAFIVFFLTKNKTSKDSAENLYTL